MTGNTNSIGSGGMPWRLLLWGGAASLLLIPAVAMQFTSEVNWTTFDFLFAGAVIGGTGLILELVFRMAGSWAYRAGAVLALGAVVMLVWINGAVGIIGSERDGANLLYAGVIFTALIGTVLAGFRARGMVWAMAAAAVATVAVPAIVWFLWPEAQPLLLAPEVPGATVVFAAVWLTAAALFHRAARAEAAA